MKLDYAIATVIAAALRQHAFIPLAWEASSLEADCGLPPKKSGLFDWPGNPVNRILTPDSAAHIADILAVELQASKPPCVDHLPLERAGEALELVKRRGAALGLTETSEVWRFVAAVGAMPADSSRRAG